MVKLLRLESTESVLNFDCSLRDSLIIKPRSQVALSSIAWEQLHPSFTVDATNDEIDVDFIDTTHGNNTLTAKLPHLTYAFENIDALVTSLQDSLNNMLTIDVPKCIGMNFEIVEGNKNNKLRLISYQNDAFDFFRVESDKDFFNVGPTKQAGIEAIDTGVYQKVGGTDTFDSALYGTTRKTYFYKTSRGCGIFRCQIHNLASSGTHGFLIGLSRTGPENLQGSFNFDTTKYEFAIECRNTSEPYRFIKRNADGTKTIISEPNNLTPTLSSIGSQNNDVLEISNNKGKLEGRIYTHASVDPILLFSEEYSPLLDVLFPIVAFKNKTNCSIMNLRYTPKEVQVASIFDGSGVYSTILSTPPPQNRNLIDFKFDFKGNTLSSYLGFTQTEYNFTQVKEFTVRATDTIEIYDRCESYIVELESFGIDSYDMSAGKQKRRFILALINNQKNVGEKDVVYDTPNPIFIDLNNKEDILLKNFNMRVLNTNEQVVQIGSVSNAVILFKSE